MNVTGSSIDKFEGKVAVVTGANAGIGYATALDLARLGFTVVIGCRDQTKAILAANQIRSESRNKNVNVEELDLSDFNSVRNFTKSFKDKYSRLDVLINNAGTITNEYIKNKDGIEMQFAVNHLGHFLLTNLLLDVIKSSAPSRIINVSSGAYAMGKIHWDDINLENSFSSFKAYSQSKLANVLFTIELAKKLEGTDVTTVALHPGFIRTDIIRNTKGCLGCCFNFFSWCCGKSITTGARTSIFCAVSDSVPQHSGSFYSDLKVEKFSKNINEEDATKLWKLSTKLVGLKK